MSRRSGKGLISRKLNVPVDKIVTVTAAQQVLPIDLASIFAEPASAFVLNEFDRACRLLPTYDPSKMNRLHGYLDGEYFRRAGYRVTAMDRYKKYDGALDGYIADMRSSGVQVIETDASDENDRLMRSSGQPSSRALVASAYCRSVDLRLCSTWAHGWAIYFGLSQAQELQSLDGWIRRRLRCVAWVQWKTPRRRFHELRRLGVSERTAFAAILSPKGPWRMSFTGALHRGLTNARFRRLGLPTMALLVKA